MVNFADDAPGYLTIRVSAPDGPMAELADVEAWTAREKYPQIMSGGSPVFGVARERPQGGWELLSSMVDVCPQSAREHLGMLCREQAAKAGEAGDAESQQRYAALGERLDWEKIDEVELDARYRVVRAERHIRSGPDGPEPPRPSDPDDHPERDSADPHRRDRSEDLEPTAGFVMDPALPTGMSEGILKADLIQLRPVEGQFPPEVHEDALRASLTHPGVVLLPAAFTVAERVGSRWRPGGMMDAPTAFQARDILSMRLRVAEPIERGLSSEQRVRYTEAADQLEAEQAYELAVEDRFLRIIRVERAVRFGPDGPEGPRPSDHDPQDPCRVLDQRLRAQGVVLDENTPIVLDETAKEFQRLFEAEMARRGKPVQHAEDDGE
ncbi:hypothetical protein ABH930_002939 [Kitasatospora sp. GAS204A]|uniref:DUF5954 family protein n=1 Tax=unclassified Kitasatospora TaxID=2633591 RepID=UPI00247506AB|nr:DUF5954 family protein [Kitasatospora sp. GAS204B]MDH6121782.1 hypothetical protein [Kitasatospora sp. GAS204B]